MSALDYTKLNRVQKTAVFLIVIGQEAAANIVRSFADNELEAVCREMAKLPVIDGVSREAALDEFSALVDMGYDCALGGTSYVRGTLEMARGEHRAAYMLERVAPTAGDNEAGGISPAQFDGMDMRQVFSLLKGEQPQTVAFLLAQLDLGKAGDILRMLEPEQRAEVIERLGEMESTSPEVVRRIAHQLNRRSDSQKPAAPAPVNRSGGAPFVANLLKSLDKETSRSLLSVLQDRNAALSETIRKKLFGFDDIGRLATPDLVTEYRLDEGGTHCDLVLMPPGAYSVEPFNLQPVARQVADALRGGAEKPQGSSRGLTSKSDLYDPTAQGRGDI